MLNLYDRVFSITNPKLYQSPYKKNLDEVWDVLKNYRLRCRLLFLNNLRTLKIEKIDEFNEEFVTALYDTYYNKIVLSSDIEGDINHEIFHSASSRKRHSSGIQYMGYGRNLTEGITEYLNLKSNKQSTSISFYQEQLFVVEFLVFIYGEKIIEPYLNNTALKFYQMFGKYKEIVFHIDVLLEKIQKNKKYQKRRLDYLYVTDIIPGVLREDMEFFRDLKLNVFTSKLIDDIFGDHFDMINSKIMQCHGNDKIDVFHYPYQNERNAQIFEEYQLDYHVKQCDLFRQILNFLVTMAYETKIPDDHIKLFMEKCYQNKSLEFQEIYQKIIFEKINDHFRKR